VTGRRNIFDPDSIDVREEIWSGELEREWLAIKRIAKQLLSGLAVSDRGGSRSVGGAPAGERSMTRDDASDQPATVVSKHHYGYSRGARIVHLLSAAVAIAALPLVFGACGSKPTTVETKTVTAPPTTSPAATWTTTTQTPTPTLVPGGWGDVPPDTDAINAMASWASKSIDDVNAEINRGTNAADALSTAADNHDIAALKTACQDMTQPLTIELPAHLPTPDADLTHALKIVVDDASRAGSGCARLADPPNPTDLRTLGDALRALGTDTRTASHIMKRDGQILTAAGQ